ncbi:MAG: hypothetical protein Q8Q62_20550 [Mesorhizobium sp.]|nr:hypothetical protein [Mesorhizobium sp.]
MPKNDAHSKSSPVSTVVLRCVLNAFLAMTQNSPGGRRGASLWFNRATRSLKESNSAYISPAERARLAAADAILNDFSASMADRQRRRSDV